MADAVIWAALLAAAGLVILAVHLERRVRQHGDPGRTGRRLAQFPERNPEPVLSVSFDARLLYANPAARALAHETLQSGDAGRILPGDLAQRIAALRNAGLAATHWEYLHGGNVLRCSLHCMEDLGVCHVYLKDLTALYAAERQVDHQLLHDLLTGLPNRRALDARLQAALSRGLPAGVMLLHIDRFRGLMETLGQASAEPVLCTVASRLLEFAAREPDCAPHRLDGAGFALLCRSMPDAERLSHLAERVRVLLAAPLRVDGRELSFTFSIGASRAPQDGDDAPTLLRRADAALQHARRSGGAMLQAYHPALDAQALQRLELEHALTHAARRGQLSLRYQPQHRIADGRLVGVEALVRWHHPTLGEVPLADFIPLAETSGAIVGIGEWVLQTVCERVRAWQAAGLPQLVVAVNLSPRHFRSHELLAHVTRTLACSRLDARWLELEITESAAMHDIEAAAHTLRSLKHLGVRIALDDFGTGHSALAWLRRLPVDKLKLDQSFVRAMQHDPVDAAIVRSVVGLGHAIGLTVLAEGVEEAAQVAMLRAMRCDLVQGYYYSRPLDEAQLLARLAAEPPADPPIRCRGEIHEHPASRVHPLRT